MAGSFLMRKAVMGLSTPPERPPDSPFYTTAEVATILRCSTRTVQNWITQGRLPAAIVGRNRYRVPKEAVDALVPPRQEAQTPMRWYLSGPMTGLPDGNRPAFQAVAATVRAAGHDVINPAELCPPGIAWKAALRIDLAALKTAHAVICLPGWEQSRGARMEVWLARRRGLAIWPVEDWLRTYAA